MLFNRDHRTFHDLIAHTDVIPLFESRSMSIEVKEEEAIVMPAALTPQTRMVILASSHSERPMATVIRLPVQPAQAEADKKKVA